MTAKKGTTKGAGTTAKPAPQQKKPEIKVSTVQAVEVVETLGLYPIKSAHGGLNIKALPLPGDRVLLILPSGSTLIEKLNIVKSGAGYVLK